MDITPNRSSAYQPTDDINREEQTNQDGRVDDLRSEEDEPTAPNNAGTASVDKPDISFRGASQTIENPGENAEKT